MPLGNARQVCKLHLSQWCKSHCTVVSDPVARCPPARKSNQSTAHYRCLGRRGHLGKTTHSPTHHTHHFRGV